MDLKKLKKKSSTLNSKGENSGSEAKKTSNTDGRGVKSKLKVDSYNNKYKNETNTYQDNFGVKKYKSGGWKLEGGNNPENLDSIDDKRKFLDENGNEVALQG
jgi:hypothetical protein